LPFFRGRADFEVVYPAPREWYKEPSKAALENDILISVRIVSRTEDILKRAAAKVNKAISQLNFWTKLAHHSLR